ncbi:MAG: hypothetical protein FWC97_03780 [Treponema sp.]|nr:hypothetical protein [Treponema sp.]
MKKCISILVLLAFLSVAAFAEFRVSFELDLTQNLLSATMPLGFDADTEANPSHRAPGNLDFFTHNRNEMRQSEMFLRFDYVLENVDARLELTGHSLVNSRDRGLREGNSFLGLFDELRIGDFWVRGNLGVAHAAYGRFHSRGVMDAYRFDNNTWWDRRYTAGNADTNPQRWVDTLGVFRFFGFQMPGFRYTEVNNHRTLHGGEHFVLVGGNFGDFGLEFSGGRYQNTAADGGSAVSFAARGSGVNVADLVTFEVMYGVTGHDRTMNMFGSNDTHSNVGPYPDGLGRWEHRFGLYGALTVMDGDLGLSFGYSGGFLAFEQWAENADTVLPHPNNTDLRRFGPLFHAVDLKAQFRGIDRLTVTSAINASFSAVEGTALSDDTWRMGLGILSNGPLDEDQEELFFGLAVGFNVGYMLTDNFDVALQVKNSTQWENYVHNATELNTTRNQLGVALSARFAITPNFSLMGGLAMQMDTITQSGQTGGGSDINFRGGDLYFGIPITLQVRF